MLDYIQLRIAAMRSDDEGQALVEYALILALVSVASIIVLGALGGAIGGVLQSVVNAL